MRVKREANRILFFPISIFIIVAFFTPAGHAAQDVALVEGQTIYVPIYSHVFYGDRVAPFNLSANLSIRNTDPSRSIMIFSVKYYDSYGKFVKSYLKEPVLINPLSSIRYYVKESDKSGGSGACFVVKWRAEEKVNAPIVEGVMLETAAGQGLSFISRGKPIVEPGG